MNFIIHRTEPSFLEPLEGRGTNQLHVFVVKGIIGYETSNLLALKFWPTYIKIKITDPLS